jgi:UDP-N-acetylmuramyl pentapeptide phosphotransferase/UDP-N-acetylglucosamine-1-phosphate transferase
MLHHDHILYLIALLTGFEGALIIKKFAFKWGLIDRPNDRSSHDNETPKGGGIGILAAFIFSSFILKLPLVLWTPAVILALVSLWGDRYNLSPKIRLPLQFIASLILVQHSAFSVQQSAILFTFMVLFIVATANWYNFMDGINGIAGITGIVVFCLLAAFNILTRGDTNYTTLSICIVFSCLGFLPLNFPKAKVFMGDVGSILLGFVFAAIVLMLSKSLLDFSCLVSFLFPFYADELITMAIRLKDGENLMRPHRRHFYQILVNEAGIAHWKVSLGYALLQLVVGLTVLFARHLGIYAVLFLLLLFFSGGIAANYLVRGKMVRAFTA